MFLIGFGGSNRGLERKLVATSFSAHGSRLGLKSAFQFAAKATSFEPMPHAQQEPSHNEIGSDNSKHEGAAPRHQDNRHCRQQHNERGDIILVKAQPNEHEKLARAPALGDRTWNYPALAGEYLLVRNDRDAMCLKLPVAETNPARTQ